MTWTSVYNTKTGNLEAYARRSPCGKYQVSKFSVRGVWHYVLWGRVGDRYSNRLGDFDSFKAAVEALNNGNKK